MSQGTLPFTCKFLIVLHVSLPLLCAHIMAAFGDFTAAFVQNMEQLQRDGQVETVALMLALVGAPRAAMHLGRPVAEMVVRRMKGDAAIDIEQIFAPVDWRRRSSCSCQRTLMRLRSTRRAFGFEEIQLTPQHAAASTTIADHEPEQAEQNSNYTQLTLEMLLLRCVFGMTGSPHSRRTRPHRRRQNRPMTRHDIKKC